VRLIVYGHAGEAVQEEARKHRDYGGAERRQVCVDGLVGEVVPLEEDRVEAMRRAFAPRLGPYLDILLEGLEGFLQFLDGMQAGGRVSFPDWLNLALRGMLLDLSVGRQVKLRRLLGLERDFYILLLPEREAATDSVYGVRFTPAGDSWFGRLWSSPGPLRRHAPTPGQADAVKRLLGGAALSQAESLALRYHGLVDSRGGARVMYFGDRMPRIVDALAARAAAAVTAHIVPSLEAWDEPAMRLGQLRVLYEMAAARVADRLPRYREWLSNPDWVEWWLWDGDNCWLVPRTGSAGAPAAGDRTARRWTERSDDAGGVSAGDD